MAKDESVPVCVTILGKEYRIACPPEEKEGLIQSAALVDEKMRELRNRGRTLGVENVAVMAALNIAHEMLVKREEEEADLVFEPTVNDRLKQLNHKIELAMADVRQMEL